ncbi:hypothetical protein C6N75_14085 [Streptomyces solincola]|uniref:Uncharacterized protein n=1 Tax=Streptomyces solincola TaxID=2100817 RepID=A0A2S9PVZ8_9ACTN|nr:hypothetical protein C6N75_14085 [Streptomyces solincola]
MPSLTVVFSSDTDICFSPGLYGDCLPTGATAGAAVSFRAARPGSAPGRSPAAGSLVLSCSHTRSRAGTGFRQGGASHRHNGHRQSDVNRLSWIASIRRKDCGRKGRCVL